MPFILKNRFFILFNFVKYCYFEITFFFVFYFKIISNLCILLDNQASRLMTPFVYYVAIVHNNNRNMTFSPNRAALTSRRCLSAAPSQRLSPLLSGGRAGALLLEQRVHPEPDRGEHRPGPAHHVRQSVQDL